MLCGVYSVVGQAEYDDMYFTSKDRVAQVASVKKEKPQNSLNALSETNAAYQAVAPNISMAGYTGRTINPDYQPGVVAIVTSSYFTPNYQPARVNNQLYTSNSNNNFNNFNNWSPYSYYGGRYGYGSYSPYGYGYNNWGYSPYANGGFYDPYYSNWGYSPYGFGNSLSMYYGMGYGGGGGYYGYGCPSSYYGYYPGSVVVANNPDNHVNTAYGKRQSRSSYTNSTANYGTRGTMTSATDQNRGGRVASTSNSYYQRGWRQDPAITQSSSSTSGSRYSGFSSNSNTRSGWSSFGNTNNTRSSWGNTTNSSFSGTTRSSMSTGSFTGGSRSSGSSFSGGSSVGGSRSSGGGSSSGGRGRGN
jgi:hypothetical protein